MGDLAKLLILIEKQKKNETFSIRQGYYVIVFIGKNWHLTL